MLSHARSCVSLQPCLFLSLHHIDARMAYTGLYFDNNLTRNWPLSPIAKPAYVDQVF